MIAKIKEAVDLINNAEANGKRYTITGFVYNHETNESIDFLFAGKHATHEEIIGFLETTIQREMDTINGSRTFLNEDLDE